MFIVLIGAIHWESMIIFLHLKNKKKKPLTHWNWNNNNIIHFQRTILIETETNTETNTEIKFSDTLVGVFWLSCKKSHTNKSGVRDVLNICSDRVFNDSFSVEFSMIFQIEM